MWAWKVPRSGSGGIYGLAVVVMFKLGLLVAFVTAVSLCLRANSRLATCAVGAGFAAYGIVVIWHPVNLV